MRSKIVVCRAFVALLLGGLTFLAMNVILLWSQSPSQQCPLCDCPGQRHLDHAVNVHAKRVVDTPGVEPSQELKKPPGPSTQRTSDLIRLLNKTRQRLKSGAESHQLAVIVPFRNRYEEMMKFVPHIHNFLVRQNVRHKIWIINQADTHRCVCMCSLAG